MVKDWQRYYVFRKILMTHACCRSALRLMLVGLAILVAGWQANAQTQSALYTYSTIDAFLAGTYDGDLSIRELSTKSRPVEN